MPKPLAAGKRGVVFAEINMIPLIDISLILLIIFMVITPVLVQSQLQVKLPKAGEGQPMEGSEAVEIEIGKDGQVAVNGRKIADADLEKELTLLLSRASDKTVLVQADKDVPIQAVVNVLDVGKRLGVGRLGIGVSTQN